MKLSKQNKTDLKAEFDTDPQVLGYATHILSGSLSALSRLINAPDPSGGVIGKDKMTVREIQGAVVRSEYNALSVNKLTMWGHFLTSISVEGYEKGLGLNPMIKNVFDNNSRTWANIKARQERIGSRAEVIIGNEHTLSAKEIKGILSGNF